METTNSEDITNSLTYLFKETFEGSPPEGGMYLDTGIGIFNSIESITEKNASKSISGASIAAHTEHIRYYLEVLNNFLNGTVQVADWSKSWNIKDVSEKEWNEIKGNLETQYKMVLETFAKQEDLSQDSITQISAMLSHSAYHLGAIRQIIKSI